MAPDDGDIAQLTRALRREPPGFDGVPSGRHRAARFAGPGAATSGSDAGEPDLIESLDGDSPVAEKPPILAVPAQIRRARIRVTGQALMGIVVIIGLAAVLWFVRLGMADPPGPEPIPAASQESGVPSTDASQATAAATPSQTVEVAAGAPPGGQIVVHVIGAVQEPGVFTLSSDERVVDAIAAAGGATDQAELGRVNLASALADGAQIWVPVAGQEPPIEVRENAAAQTPIPATDEGGPSEAGGQPVPLNTATVVELETIPGVGPVTAQRIVEFREEGGGFTSVEQLLDVSGIGEKTLASLKPYVSVG